MIELLKSMQKNNTLKKPKIMIPHHEYWTTYLQSIQKALSNEYYYYKTGTIPAEKLDDVLVKLNDYYRLDDTPKERFNRFKSGLSVVVIYLLKVADTYYFILMARANESKSGLFFEREKYADASDKKHRISFNDCYEFVRVNKSGYEFEKKENKDKSEKIENKDSKDNKKKIQKIFVSGKNEVWTIKISNKEQNRIVKNFNDALKKNNFQIIKQICYGMCHWIGFSGVREDYVVLKNKLQKRFAMYYASFPRVDKPRYQYKILDDVYKMPPRINNVRFGYKDKNDKDVRKRNTEDVIES